MNPAWRETTLGQEIDFLYGKSLPEQQRRVGNVPVYGSNGRVGTHDTALVTGPGVVIGRKGSVGAVAYAEAAYWPIDTTYYVGNPGEHDWKFLYYLLKYLRLDEMNGHAVVPGLNRDTALSLRIRVPDSHEQQAISSALWLAERATSVELQARDTVRDLRQAVMRKLFARGLRGERLRETAVGHLPETWNVVRLESCCDVVSSSMSYGDLSVIEDAGSDSVETMGVKVSDMNRPGNERWFTYAALEKRVTRAVAKRRLVPPDTIVFPKRGAAIATNKKRLTTAWTALDPNLIGVRPGERLTTSFLFYWFEQFDLRTITEPGPTPQLNKKNLVPLLVPVPSDLAEQHDIVSVLEAIDAKIALHERKRATLQELFDTLLHDLMTGRLRVRDLAPA